MVYGGGAVGLMAVVADATLAAAGAVIGVIPSGLFEREVAHRGRTELREVASMHERKQLMFELAQGFVALPGGLGTLEELTEMATWDIWASTPSPSSSSTARAISSRSWHSSTGQ